MVIDRLPFEDGEELSGAAAGRALGEALRGRLAAGRPVAPVGGGPARRKSRAGIAGGGGGRIKPATAAGFAAFHRDNPKVYAALVRFAREAKAAGRTRIGIKALIERFRWYTAVEVNGAGDGFKINNSWAPFYARLIASDSEFRDLFEVRRSVADGGGGGV